MERVLREILPDGFQNVRPQRSRLMSKIKPKGNKSTELPLRLALVRARVSGWQMQPSDLVGRPDFYFRRKRLAVFVDGCFWHACSRCGHLPHTRSSFWKLKFKRNRRRARIVAKELRQRRITIIRFWEHEVKRNPDRVAKKIRVLLSS